MCTCVSLRQVCDGAAEFYAVMGGVLRAGPSSWSVHASSSTFCECIHSDVALFCLIGSFFSDPEHTEEIRLLFTCCKPTAAAWCKDPVQHCVINHACQLIGMFWNKLQGHGPALCHQPCMRAY